MPFQVDEAVAIALNEPHPPPEVLFADVYHNNPPELVRGITFDDTVVQPFATTSDLLKAFGKK